MYKDLVNDCSASANLSESEIDRRIAILFELEEPSLVFDLRYHFNGKQTKFDIFWENAKQYLEEDIGTTVDDRRHSTVLHVANAISVRDLCEQVSARCPDGTAIPCDEWICQFAPINALSCTALRYTGCLKVRHQVQQPQWRKQHPDSHYAACIYCYEREYAVLMREYSAYLSIIPSVVLQTEIPEEFSGLWYDGQVMVMLKGAFEPSSPARHSTEMATIINQEVPHHPILLIYSDGGPDHRLTNLSVKLALIGLYLKLDLDYLCAARTAPYHSYHNPVEQIMSIINLGLQALALARAKMPDEMETLAKKCNRLKALRKVAQGKLQFEMCVWMPWFL